MAVQREQQVWQAPRLAQMALDMLELAELRGLEAQALDKSAQLQLEPVERQALAAQALDMSEPVAGLAAQLMGPRLRLEYIHLAPARKARLPRRLALMLRPNRQP